MTQALKALWRPFVGAACGVALSVALFVDKASQAKMLVVAGVVTSLAAARTVDKLKAKDKADV